jgi:hypothetical protein
MGFPAGRIDEQEPGLAVVVRLTPRPREARGAEAFSLLIALTLALAAAVAIST